MEEGAGRESQSELGQHLLLPLLCQPPVLCSLFAWVMTTGTRLMGGEKNFSLGWVTTQLPPFCYHDSLSPLSPPHLCKVRPIRTSYASWVGLEDTVWH